MKIATVCTMGLLLLGYPCWAQTTEESAPAVDRARSDSAFFIAGALNAELRAQEASAFQAYSSASPEVAAWALEELLKSYQRNGLILRDLQADWDQASQSQVMFAHARLSKIYTALQKDDLAQSHLSQAVALADGEAPEDLLRKVAALDAMQAP